MARKTVLARELRRNQTDAEKHLWLRLRNRQLEGFKFRRQMPIGRYVVDFICPDKNLVIELDGGHHADQVSADKERSRELGNRGYHVIRFWNNDVLSNTEGVLEIIRETLLMSD